MTKEKLQWNFEFRDNGFMIACTSNSNYKIALSSNGKNYFIITPLEENVIFNNLQNAIEFCEVHYSHIHDTKLFEDYLLGG